MKIYVYEESEYCVRVTLGQTVITFEGTTAKEDANKFLIDLLKDTGRVSY